MQEDASGSGLLVAALLAASQPDQDRNREQDEDAPDARKNAEGGEDRHHEGDNEGEPEDQHTNEADEEEVVLVPSLQRPDHVRTEEKGQPSEEDEHGLQTVHQNLISLNRARYRCMGCADETMIPSR